MSEPELRRTKIDPKGVLQKNLKTFVYLGAALLVIAAALFSSTAKKTPTQQAAAKGQPPQPTLQDNTDNNVQDLKNQLKAERDKEAQQQAPDTANSNDPALASATPAQRAAAAAYGPTGVAVPVFRIRPIRGNHASNRATVRQDMGSRQTHSPSYRRNSNRHSSSPRKNASAPMSRASLRILCTPVPRNSRKCRGRSRPRSMFCCQDCPAAGRIEPTGTASRRRSPRAGRRVQTSPGGKYRFS